MGESATERWDEIMDAGDSVAFKIEMLKRYVRDFPENGAAWLALGIQLVGVSRFSEGKQALERALGLHPGKKWIRLVECAMGDLFRNQGDAVLAEQWYRKAIEHGPDDAQGYIYLGAMLARLGRLGEAEEIHRRGTSCSEGCVDEAWYNLGLVLRAQERYSEAAECFERALKLDPQYKIARLAKRDVERAMRVVSGDGTG